MDRKKWIENMKFCECGCGKEVTKESNRFISGHNGRVRTKEENLEISKRMIGNTLKKDFLDGKNVKYSKLCHCGCGKYAKPGNRFIKGHHLFIESLEDKNKRLLHLINNKFGLGKKHSEEHKRKISDANRGRKHTEETREILRRNAIKRGIPEETRRKAIIAITGKGSPFWKGGVCKRNIALYETYAHQLVPMEEVRRIRFTELGQANLRVRCYHCKKWMIPTRIDVDARLYSLNSGSDGSHFYCNDNCKFSCSIYRQVKYPKGYNPTSNRPYIDPYWRSEVIKRARGKCERCDVKTDKLHAHHEKSATLFPMLANDIGNGWAVCEPCHYILIHGQEGCRMIDLRRIEC